MKTVKKSDNRKNREKNRCSLRTRLTLLVTAELVFCVLVALGLNTLLEGLIDIDSPLMLMFALLAVSLLIGFLVTSFLSKLFFDPIKKLRKAMERVAEGDFTVRLEEKSSSREISEIYSGFNLMAKELGAKEILQTDFVSNVSHEFKTPINAIEGYTTLLQSDNLDDEQKQYVEKILFNTRRLSSLVGSILLLSKIENQSIQTNRARYRLDEQIRQSIVALESDWEKKDIEFDVDMDRVEYVGDEPMMRHVWDNLISNAIKFNPPGGMVQIRLSQTGEDITFTIEDCGPGLTEEAKKHIFDKFYQADSSHREEGNGLGLSLVKRILTISGGEVSAENREDGGCRFTVTLTEK